MQLNVGERGERDAELRPNWGSRMVAWLAVSLFLGALVLLIWFVPAIAAVMFVALVTFTAVAIWKTDGFWSGLKHFVSEILFGW